jgi:histidinol dehydrogenase
MNIPIYYWSTMNEGDRNRIFSRSESDITTVLPGVKAILDQVKTQGDSALRSLSKTYDQASFDHLPLKVTDEEFVQAEKSLSLNVKQALDYAIENVWKFHAGQKPKSMEFHQIRPGILAGERARPIQSVGLYVPRGRGSFPSMLYMLAIPAKIAGVPDISIITPPGANGEIDSACLYAASKIGVRTIYRVGGAQGIAALAYGTESIPKALKVIGPGSIYVTAAKRLLSDLLDPGLPAGPSESILWSDGSGNPHNLALDLLIEAEHGADSSALLVTESEQLAEKIASILPAMVDATPEPRRSFLLQVFSDQGYGGIMVTKNQEESADLINTYAPEHLSIQTSNPWDATELITNAGEILLGSHLPFSAANYLTGANAVLPTGAKAKSWGGVSVRDFISYSSIVQVTEKGYQDLKNHVIALAEYEGFPSHAAALSNRQTPKN